MQKQQILNHKIIHTMFLNDDVDVGLLLLLHHDVMVEYYYDDDYLIMND